MAEAKIAQLECELADTQNLKNVEVSDELPTASYHYCPCYRLTREEATSREYRPIYVLCTS